MRTCLPLPLYSEDSGIYCMCHMIPRPQYPGRLREHSLRTSTTTRSCTSHVQGSVLSCTDIVQTLQSAEMRTIGGTAYLSMPKYQHVRARI
ncbi:hypothetical protein FKP32DRAFT_1104928 [Trametes sanguinea]|nr:hypothetical protein FKP32DRAFT_1104928 [Trametes sanguinea]